MLFRSCADEAAFSSAVRIAFTYELRNESGELLTEASTTLVFVDRTTMRPARAPQPLLEALRPYFT